MFKREGNQSKSKKQWKTPKVDELSVPRTTQGGGYIGVPESFFYRPS